MYWPLRVFDATGQPYFHSPVGAVLHRIEWNSTVFQFKDKIICISLFKKLYWRLTLLIKKKLYFKENVLYICIFSV